MHVNVSRRQLKEVNRLIYICLQLFKRHSFQIIELDTHTLTKVYTVYVLMELAYF